MNVACILIDHLPYKLEIQRDPGLVGRGALIFQCRGSMRTVLDVPPDTPGVTPGMPLQEALSRCREGVPVEADVPHYERVFNHILSSLEDWSPVVEGAGIGCAYVGLDGLEETYGGHEQLISGLLQAVPQHLEPRLGIGRGKFPAYLAALSAGPGEACGPPPEVRQFLAPFPVEVLPVPWEVKDRLRSFGLDTLGRVADLPLGPIQAQFGPTGQRLWRLARGTDDTPLLPRRPEEELSASVAFPVPTANMEPLLMAVDNMLAGLFARPEMRGRYARIALLEGDVLHKPPWRRRISFKTPAGDRRRAYLVLKGALESAALPGPLAEVRITLKELIGEAGRQESLFREVRRRDQLRQAMAQLKAAQERDLIYRVREVEPWSRIPERRWALITYEP
ncbi:MAG: DNA polymerase Y family protein [Dehalococcoidia bacterium]